MASYCGPCNDVKKWLALDQKASQAIYDLLVLNFKSHVGMLIFVKSWIFFLHYLASIWLTKCGKKLVHKSKILK